MIKILPSKTQWKRFKWITKFGIIAGYASILGIILWVLQEIISPPVKREDLEPIAKQVDIELIKKQLDNVSIQLKQNIEEIDTIRYPGYTIDLLVLLKANYSDHKAFIVDRGKYMNKERISIYINTNNELCFRIIDSSEEIHTISIPSGPNSFQFDSLLFLVCEYGEDKNESFQRLLINGKTISYLKFANNLKLSRKIPFVGSTIGADLKGENCANLMAAFSAQGRGTYTKLQIIKFEEATRRFLEQTNYPLKFSNCKFYWRTKENGDAEEIKTDT